MLLPVRRTARTAGSPARQHEPTSFMRSSRLAQLSADLGTVQHLDVAAGGNTITWWDVSVVAGRTADVNLPNTCP
jgi:hypothetical protein